MRERLKVCFRRFFADNHGVALVEFAVALPILILMILGGFEAARYILLQQKLNGAAVTMADLAAQSETLTAAELDTLFAAVDYVIRPFTMGGDGVVIVSSIGATGGSPVEVYWQRKGAGSLASDSVVAPGGTSVSLPSGFVVRDGESVIVSEVFFRFTPILVPNLFPSAELYHRAFLRPRFGSLSSLG